MAARIEPLRTLLRDRLDADAAHLADVPAEALLQEAAQLLGFGRTGLDLEAGVDVLGVLAKDDHVDQFGVLDRRGHALEPAHRAQADVEVEDLAQRDVERAEAAADRRGERALDADQVVAKVGDGLLGQPVAGLVEGLLSGEDFLPLDGLAVLLRGRVEDELGRGPDVDADAVALDERDDGVVRDVEFAVGVLCDFLSHGAILRRFPRAYLGRKSPVPM